MAIKSKKVIWEPHPGSQKLFLSCPADEVLLHGNRGSGKALPFWSMVKTPEGYTTIDKIAVGDMISSTYGVDQEVLGVYPQGKLEVIEFQTNERTVYSSIDHLWVIKLDYSCTEWFITNTEEIVKFINAGRNVYLPVYTGVIEQEYPNILKFCKTERIIHTIQYSNKFECICIKTRTGLFITNDEVVTHNTDVLIMDFLQHVGQGFSRDWMGIIFRQEYTQLIDVINKCNKWIPQIFPGAKYNGSEHKWTFPDGEMLYLRNLARPQDYYGYHGWNLQWIAFEELTNWATMECYQMMLSTLRSSNSEVPLKVRSTTNPSGPGHAAVKRYFIDQSPSFKIHTDEETKRTRVHIPCMLDENLTLLESNPDYMSTIKAATQDDPSKYKAWVLGSWDIIAGGALVDLWEPDKQIFRSFRFPPSWSVYRSFDWGSSRPWAVTYGAECNGEQPDDDIVKKYHLPYFPKGSIIIINEIYGWNGTVNEGDRATSQEIAERTLAVDDALRIEYKCKIYAGPADTSIWEVRDGTSIASNMTTHGLYWKRAYKGSGSRVAGLSLIRQMLGASKRGDLESPGLYFFEQARHHIRTFPLLQTDPKKPEDIDTNDEDHCFTGDTLIKTDKGNIPIKDLVGTTGKVLSVNGKYQNYCNVRKTRKLKVIEITFEDGFKVCCTPDHEFLTNNGMTEANLLTLKDTYCIVSKINRKENSWNTLKLYQRLFKTLKEKIIIFVENTSKEKVQGSTVMEVGFTEKCILKTLVKYQKDLLYIIKTGIKEITNLLTLEFYQIPSTVPYIKKDINAVCLKNALKKRQNGTKVKKGLLGIKRIMSKIKVTCIELLSANALIAVKSTKQDTIKKEYRSAPISVNQHLEGNQGLMTLKESVSYVPKHLRSISTMEEGLVVVNAAQNYVLKVVQIRSLSEEKSVYCMEVKGTHTFALANGVIVSNCYDSTRYLITRKMSAMKRRKVNY